MASIKYTQRCCRQARTHALPNVVAGKRAHMLCVVARRSLIVSILNKCNCRTCSSVKWPNLRPTHFFCSSMLCLRPCDLGIPPPPHSCRRRTPAAAARFFCRPSSNKIDSSSPTPASILVRCPACLPSHKCRSCSAAFAWRILPAAMDACAAAMFPATFFATNASATWLYRKLPEWANPCSCPTVATYRAFYAKRAACAPCSTCNYTLLNLRVPPGVPTSMPRMMPWSVSLQISSMTWKLPVETSAQR